MLPHAHPGARHAAGWVAIRAGWDGQDGECESARCAVGPVRACVLLRRDIRLQGDGSYLCWVVPGRRVGLLRRVQSARRTYFECGVAAGPDDSARLGRACEEPVD